MRTISRAPSHTKRTLVTVNPARHINFVHARRRRKLRVGDSRAGESLEGISRTWQSKQAKKKQELTYQITKKLKCRFIKKKKIEQY